jgi:hypothetical protein
MWRIGIASDTLNTNPFKDDTNYRTFGSGLEKKALEF